MLHDDQIRQLHDFPNASDCFPGVEIKGGVCYFLWERGSHGPCTVFTHRDSTCESDVRPLLEEGQDVFIRTKGQVSILNKIRAHSESVLADEINAGRFFGFHTRVTWNGERGSLQTADGKSSYPIARKESKLFDIKVYIAGGSCYISRAHVTRHAEALTKWKVLIPRSGNPGGTILSKPKISEPGSCSSNTYNVMLVADEESANNAIAYLKTRFVRFLIATRTTTQDMAPKSFEFVPKQDFSIEWTDELLYERYGLSDNEVKTIEDTIPEMA